MNVVVSTVGGGGVAPDGGLRNQGADMEGQPRTEHAHEESWETTLRILAVTLAMGGRAIQTPLSIYSCVGLPTQYAGKRRLNGSMARG